MPDPLSLDQGAPVTSMSLTDLFMRTRPLLVALRDVVKPQALRRGDALVPAAIESGARHLLAETRRIVARQRGTRSHLTLAGTPDWASLLTRLEFALVALAAFQEKYSDYDPAYEAVVWRDEVWLELYRESANDPNGLDPV